MKRALEAPAVVKNGQASSEYAKVVKFEEIDEVSIFKKNDYKVSVSHALRFSHTRPLICVFDTERGLKLIRSAILEPNWKYDI